MYTIIRFIIYIKVMYNKLLNRIQCIKNHFIKLEFN